MRIVIDMQGVQTESRFRGIGRYTMSFVQALCRYQSEHEIILVLSGLFPHTIEPIRASFENLLPQKNICVWNAPGVVHEAQLGNDRRRQTAELIREAFLASLNADVIHISSLFEGYVDDAVTSIGGLSSQTPVSVSLYDLIPLLNSEQYLDNNSLYAQYYHKKIGYLKQASILLAISEYTKQEAIKILPVAEEKVCNISAAIEPCFKPIEVSEQTASQLRKKFNITKPYVLYTGGADSRKNLIRLVEAYAALPDVLRQESQLIFAGKIHSAELNQLKQHAELNGMQADELCFTGYVSDEELVQLINLCHLFVFPSWHEGFGLPALEAMSCGAVVVGANTSCLPEVIGLESAMFDPLNVHAMSQKMQQAMQNKGFREEVRAHGLRQAKNFSWDSVAQKALNAWTEMVHVFRHTHDTKAKDKPKLAFVSPLPPERTGIADFSAELLPELAKYYAIELIVEQSQVDLGVTNSPYQIHDVEWFRENAENFDRVLYQFGNSPFHKHMLSLVIEIPGIVVMHDFYASSLVSWLDTEDNSNNPWKWHLWEDHGYFALKIHSKDPKTAQLKYPVNGSVLSNAQAIIVHSQHSLELIHKWYGAGSVKNAHVLPLLRQPAQVLNSNDIRQNLGLMEDDFVICSFGFLDASKLNNRLINAWLNSRLSKDPRCKLVFVGQNEGGQYGAEIQKMIAQSGVDQQIRITGYVTTQQYKQYLNTADLAVQLRSSSRGETSAAALDVLNHGLPTIINAHGSMAEIDDNAVWMLQDLFEDEELTQALETLWQETNQRKNLGQKGQHYCQQKHAPQVCAQAYAQVIEKVATKSTVRILGVTQKIAAQLPPQSKEDDLKGIAQALADNFPQKKMLKRLYIDVTATRNEDRKTGIERVTRAILLALLQNPPVGYLVEPVYLAGLDSVPHYRHAIDYTLQLLKCTPWERQEEPIEAKNGDILLILDLSGDPLIKAQQSGLHERYRQMGIAVHAVVYDLLPVRMPEVFPPGADQSHAAWLRAISSFDGALSISRAVQQDLLEWQTEQGLLHQSRRPFKSNWFHLGSDLDGSDATYGLPENAHTVLAQIHSLPTFLMVGTIEPRKGHNQVLQAFNQLWQEGQNIQLVIIGNEGWKGLDTEQRRDIPLVVEQLRQHTEKNKRLHWLEGISDEYLKKVYAASTCLIAASWGEGFGLPLIEAAHHEIPILARDLPVFREVAGPHASYFTANDSSTMAKAIKDWLREDPVKVPQSKGMLRQTWAVAAQQLSTSLTD